jgi:hypothetical protein
MNEWDNEPDRKHWIDTESGLDCLIVRNRLGALCGYVGVPQGHSWYGKDYADVDADVHGGLTFAGECGDKICHDERAEVVANADVWWLGFDCAHFSDLVPWVRATLAADRVGRALIDDEDTYKNIAYVENECRSLAAQAQAAQSSIDERRRYHGNKI